MTLLNYEEVSSVKKAIEVEIPADLIASEEKRVSTEFARQAKLPGFRPGKIPMNIVRSKFQKEIQDEVMNRLLPLTFREAMQEKGLEPVGDPHLEHLDPFISGAPVKYKAQFEVKPRVELGDYRGLEINEPKVEVADSDIDEMVERLREQGSHYRPVSDRGLAPGDFAVIDIVTTPEGGVPKTDSGHFKLDEDSPLPELHDMLRNQPPGFTGSFDKTYPEDAANELWRGKIVRHDVTLKEIRVQEKPEVNDELAKTVGDWETVADMRAAIGADIRRHRETEAMRAKRDQIGEALLARHEFEVPDTLVEEELGKSLNNYARYLTSQGVDLEKVEIDWRKIGEDFRPEAAKRVKRSLILETIAKKEGLTVSDVEVDAEIRRATREQDRDFAEVKHRLRHDGGYEALRLSLMQERALELVLREARVR